MNDPLKHKLFSVYGQIMEPKHLTAAWKKVKANKGAKGLDNVTIEDFEANLEENIQQTAKELRAKEYTPTPVRRVYIPKKNGKLRPLGVPTVKDRVIQQAVVQAIEPFFEENVFHENSCGFRPNRGAQTVVEKIICRLDADYTYIYDFDIKGFFDNIPHKKLMKVLSKYIADGSVLDLIYKWLKAGYMEEGVVHPQMVGQPQGGVISPILANIYLNELDWELHKAGIQSVRYADDSICMCKTPEELKKAVSVVGRVMGDLGLDLAPDKTKEVDFRFEDFNFLGFTFTHIRRDKGGNEFYYVRPTDDKVKAFKQKMRDCIRKSVSKSYAEWIKFLNPIIRGTYNYWLIPLKAWFNVNRAWRDRGKPGSKARFPKTLMRDMDSYIRQRLRVNFANRGKRHARRVDGYMHHVKYNNRFFVKELGLCTGRLLVAQMYYPAMDEVGFLGMISEHEKLKRARRKLTPAQKAKRNRYFDLAYAK